MANEKAGRRADWRHRDGEAETYFASPERLAPSEVREQAERIARDPIVRAILDSMDGYLLVLNSHRQLLVANQQLLKDTGRSTSRTAMGLRPGELLHCIHAQEGPGGCGTSHACAGCGATSAVLESQQTGSFASGESLLTLQVDQHTMSFEFRVRATPIRIEGEDLTVVVMVDISGEKRRDTLERVFFHDIMNTIGGLRGWSRMLLNDVDSPAPERAAERICALSKRLLDEIEGQRQLLSAEKGNLVVSRENTLVSAVLEQLRAVFSAHRTARNRILEIGDVDEGEAIDTDPSLLMRVLTNMVKNALEATGNGEIVRVWHDHSGAEHVFHVWNPGEIKQEVALQIFQRTFSTKGQRGRGIGTYSMKLFGERYLGGRVAFESTREKGTDFTLHLPHTFLRDQDGPSSN